MSFPEVVEGCRVRKLVNGAYWVPRADEKTLVALSKAFPRLGNKPIFVDPDDFENTAEKLSFENKTVLVLGKGPSIQDLDPNKLEFDEVIFINDSYKKFPNLDGYVFTQDYVNINYPEEKVVTNQVRIGRHPKAIVIFPELYDLTCSAPTAAVVFAFLKQAKVKNILISGFDSLSGDTAYADGFSHGRLLPKRLIDNNKIILPLLEALNYTVVCRA